MPMNPMLDITWWASMLGVVISLATILGWFIKTCVLDKWEAKAELQEERRQNTEDSLIEMKAMLQTISADVQKTVVTVERLDATLIEHNHKFNNIEDRVQRLENRLLWERSNE